VPAAKPAEETKDETQSEEEPKKPASASGKAVEHLAEAIGIVNSRVIHTSENNARDVDDHIAAAVAHVQGNSDAAKEASERIAGRNPEA